MNKPQFSYSLLHPKHLPSWIAMALWWSSVQLLPFPIQIWLGKKLGDLFYFLNIERCKVARRNIELCFPELEKNRIETLLRLNLQSTAIGIFESGAAWFLPRYRLINKCEIEGLEHLHSLNGMGALFMGLHFTAIEIGAAFVNLKFPIDGFYRPHKNPVYEYVQAWGRTRHNDLSKVIPNFDLRRIVKELRSGEVVNYAPDQDYGRRRSVFSPFFKIPTATVKAPVNLAKSGKAEIVPWVTSRVNDFGKYKITIFAPITSLFTEDEQENALKLNQFIEARIRENPEQYLWVHRRFKTRPEGVATLYDF